MPFIGMALLSLSACATVELKDFEACGDKVDLGATCFHSLTPETRKLTKEEWDKIRFGRISLHIDAFLYMKSAIEKLCSVSDRCTYEEKEQLSDFFSRVESFQGEVMSHQH